MRQMLCGAGLALVLTCPVAAPGATDQVLPAETARGLEAATGALDIAALVAARPALAATILSEAAVLGVASPAQVVAVLAQDLDLETLAALVRAAAEAAPGEADITARAAVEAAETFPEEIAVAAVDGIEAVRPALTGAAIAAEAAEILATLGRVAPDRARGIAAAIAVATDTPDDNAETLLAAAVAVGSGIETADTGPPGQARRRPGRVPFFVELPDRAQASPN